MSESITRTEILRVAAEEFGQKGFRGARLDDVANQLGVTRQALYYYYPTKTAILLDLYERFFERLEAALDEAERSHAGRGRFDAMLEAHIRTVAESPELSAIFTQERSALPYDMSGRLRLRRQKYQDRLVQAYRDGVEAGELRDDASPSVTVSLAVGAANWIFRWYRSDRDLQPGELAMIAVDLLGTGYHKAPGRRRAATASRYDDPLTR
ncbi:MAG: TetR/AcrR family transcriptional regulator, cholesterol catabolism regulator [Frankiaceae bacterium]|jgi:AcrR family transcriptional regulator|nr:TetR/AcrR family transcriptional regulator, cholesterol catabolism regulator [Frankiaceae bacterium]